MIIPAPDEALWVGVMRLGLTVPGSRTLKDKRQALHSVRDRLRARHKLSVAEVGHHDDVARAVLALAMVGNDPAFLRSALDGLRHEVEGWGQVWIDACDVTILRPWDGGAPGRYDARHG